jgi:ribosomal protein L21
LNNREQNPTPPEQTTQTPEQGSQAPQQRPAQNSERKNRRAPESARRTAERRAELERQQAETENLAVKERREKAIQAAKDAIEKAEAILASGQLTDTERKNCQWAIKSAKAAYEQSLAQSRDTYTVKAIEAGTNRVIAEREEGMPVDGILGVLEQTRQKLEHKRDIKDQAGLSYQRYRLKISEVDEQSKSEEEKKLAWHSAFHEILPAGHFLRKEAEKMVAQWERADSRQYSEAEKKLQLGEALKQVLVREGFVEKSVNGKIVSKDVVVANPEELASLKKIVDILTKESKKYFDYHRTQGHEQHPFTHRESDFVAKDPQYRAVLLKKYTDQNEIPANFGQMTKLDQDYLLAELAVRDRRVLDLPKEVAVPEKALPKTIFRINISELAKRMAQTLADARLDQHYDEDTIFASDYLVDNLTPMHAGTRANVD